jgi:hypothetical protein
MCWQCATGGAAVCDDQRIQLDKAVAFLLVIAGDLCARDQFVATPRRRQQLHPAADMNPWTEDGVIDQHPVHHPLHQPGMAKSLAWVDRVTFAHVAQIFVCGFSSPCARHRAQPLAEFI